MGGIDHNEALMLATNDELMREVRRRLALGARTGSYLTSTGQQVGCGHRSSRPENVGSPTPKVIRRCRTQTRPCSQTGTWQHE